MKANIVNRVDYLAGLCRGKRVLHLGCTSVPFTQEWLEAGHLLHERVERVAAVQYGIDSSEEGVELLRKRGYGNLAVADVEELATRNPFGQVEFDVILGGEILEHLSNPGRFLEGLKPFLHTPGSRLVLTAPNSYCAYRFLYTFLTGREGVNPDHVAYYSPRTLTRLATRHGYSVEDWCYYRLGNEFEKTLNRGWGRILWWTDRVASLLLPALGEGLIMTCKLEGPSEAVLVGAVSAVGAGSRSAAS